MSIVEIIWVFNLRKSNRKKKKKGGNTKKNQRKIKKIEGRKGEEVADDDGYGLETHGRY